MWPFSKRKRTPERGALRSEAGRLTFTWLNKQGVASSEGWSLQCVARFAWEYRKGDFALRLEGEPLAMGGFEFGREFRRAEEPHRPVSLSAADHAEIEAHVKAALKFMGGFAEFA